MTLQITTTNVREVPIFNHSNVTKKSLTNKTATQQHNKKNMSPRRILDHPIVSFLANNGVIVGLFIRIFLAWFLPWLLDDGKFIPGVAYTDIDFLVFTDAANYIKQGRSPYDRHTYRYTPFLAQILAWMPREAGRYLFCIADTICGWTINSQRSSKRRREHGEQQQREQQEHLQQQQQSSTFEDSNMELLQDSLWWLYNPLAINICTRGSSESLMVLLPVLLTLVLVTTSRDENCKATMGRAFLAGLVHGIAIHAKLYPIIYSLSYMSYFATQSSLPSDAVVSSLPLRRPSALLRLVLLWAKRLFTPVPLIFVITALGTFFGITYVGIQLYGDEALHEGLLYHFSRVDHRHNYSMYWYWIYLVKANPSTNLALTGRLLLLPQIILLVYSSLGVAPYNLGLAIFIQTYLFVTHNKVITAQYFTWYLCLLPLCSDSMTLTRQVKVSILILLLSIGTWLGSAYCLEMQGMAVHKLVWMASVFYFFANVNLMGALLRSHSKHIIDTKKRLSTQKVKDE